MVLVDTPGFDDTNEDDSEILRRIAVWLAESFVRYLFGDHVAHGINRYDQNMTVAGVLYFHDIGQKRMLGSTRMNLRMFESLVGIGKKGRLPIIALVTSQWDLVRPEVGSQREEELKGAFWKDAIRGGAIVERVDGQGSHARIVNAVLKASEKRSEKEASSSQRKPQSQTSMLIQHEFVDNDVPIPLTEAGQKLRYNLDDLLKHQAEIARIAENDAKRVEAEQKLESLRRQKETLKVSVAQRIKTGFAAMVSSFRQLRVLCRVLNVFLASSLTLS